MALQLAALRTSQHEYYECDVSIHLIGSNVFHNVDKCVFFFCPSGPACGSFGSIGVLSFDSVGVLSIDSVGVGAFDSVGVRAFDSVGDGSCDSTWLAMTCAVSTWPRSN